ncbi:hypothetical protein QUF72_23070 [Desulfobacterales bacterium HSG2]|nr:hypothetical protein [Desulfobacterales bacterium HSG2]
MPIPREPDRADQIHWGFANPPRAGSGRSDSLGICQSPASRIGQIDSLGLCV